MIPWKATESRSAVWFSTVTSTPVADFTLPHWEATAVCETRTIEIEREPCVARCSPSLSLMQRVDGLGPPLIQSMPYARLPSHQVPLSVFSVFLFVKGE